MNNKTIVSLQFLRGLAALFIVALHTLEGLVHNSSPSEISAYNVFGVGVDIFFVISGFVMEYLTNGTALEPSCRLSAAFTFLKKRVIRIVPLYWFYTTLKICLLIAFPFLALRTTFDTQHIVFSYLFIPTMAPWGIMQPFLPVGWTLNFEMFFYLVFAVAILFGVNRIFFASTVFIVISLVTNSFDANVDILSFYSRPIIFEFVGGMIIANIYRSPVKPLPAFFTIVLLLASISYLIFIYAYSMPDLPRIINVGIPAVLIVYSMLNIENYLSANQVFVKLAKLGDSSYTTYLLHTFIVPAIPKIFSKFNLHSKVGIFVFSVVITMWLSWFAYIYIEKKLIHFMKNIN